MDATKHIENTTGLKIKMTPCLGNTRDELRNMGMGRKGMGKTSPMPKHLNRAIESMCAEARAKGERL